MMTLEPQETSELEFIQILKSKHARYIDGYKVVSKDEVAKDYIPPGAAMGVVTATGKHAPVTRDEVATGGATASSNTIPLANLSDSEWHNWQVGDSIICDPGETDEETAEITEIDESAGELTVDGITTDHSEGVTVQKNDGSSTAEFVCLELVDLTEEDQLVGGIVHGAVYSDRMPNYDSGVAEDLNMIDFE